MRPVRIGDAVAAARALLAVPAVDRAALAHRLIDMAEAADAFRLRQRRLHPEAGNGTLMAAALARPCRPEPGLDDPDYLDCLITVLCALRDCRRYPPADAQATQSRAAGSSASRASGISSPHSSQ